MILSSPLFLIGLVAVAIPVIVHLFNFRRYKKVYFSNVERLEQLQSETRRQSTLRQLLIMFARILAIVFLVLAFARPVIPNRNSAMRSGSNDISIFIDNSFSMESNGGSGTLLEQAKTKAREIVAAYGPTDRFQLMTNDIEGRHFHWLSKDDVLLMIDEVEVSSASMPLSTLLQRQFDFVNTGRSDNKYAYIITDFQSSIADFEAFPADSCIIATLVPLASSAQNNVYIDSLSLNAPVLSRGNSVVAQVWVANEGDEDLEKVPVSLYVNDRQRALATVDLPARSTSTVDMHFTIDATGIFSGRVETTDYPISFDDKLFFTLNVRDRIKMLTVEGKSANENLRRLFEGDSVVAYASLGLQQMDFSRIESNDVILLDELPSLSTGMAQTLHTFVEDGGTLVVVMGEDVDQTSYNEALRLFAAPQITGRNKSRVAAGTVNFDNALYQNVFSGRTDDMEMPSVTDYYRLSSTSATLNEPVITLANGDSYVSVTPCGAGRLYLIAAPLRDAHTDFVRQALFVPTLYNMALYSLRPLPLYTSMGQANPVPLSTLYDAAEGNVKLTQRDGDYEEIPDIRCSGNNSMLIPHATIKEAGNYILVQGGKETEGLSFNYSRLESQMDFLDRDAITKQLKDYNLNTYSVVRNADKPLDTYIKEQTEGRRLWRWCLAASLLMLLAEIALIRLPFRKNRKKSQTV